MSIYRQRDIVLVPFPFSDLSGQKVRPVLILSNDAYNRQSADVVVCGLTTNLSPVPYSITIEVTDVEQPGTLRHKSRIKADTIASLEQTILIKQIARLKLPVFRQAIAMIEDLISRRELSTLRYALATASICGLCGCGPSGPAPTFAGADFSSGGPVDWPSCLFGGTISLEVSMTTITIALPDDHSLKLKEMAARFGVAPEELVRVSIEELLTRPEEAFERAVDYVLNKNAELYRRLA